MELKHVSFQYKNNDRQILDDISITFENGTFYSIFGPSGSGKTTLLSLLGGLDVPSTGEILIDGKGYGQIGYTKLRRHEVSFVFQSYHLLPYMTALENVILPMSISKSHREDRKEYAKKLLFDLGLQEDEIHRKTKHLSGGQQQRVSIARALSCDARYILADEPTGNLDRKTAEGIVDIFGALAHEHGRCVIVVTHSQEVRDASDVALRLYDRSLTM
ncbi:ABC transporter ATP-binding protein [Candidatus Soleaferrea massiliensis]|uniref:ABC transporter ATP-binding protein n=1 Tax=Candidatus Soleaferrea massiliensis TaxID=1470354 RepID=UPI001FA7A163|nr:ABC transporter ATP-binding protein [Candidatus Soleaferrea massiliensis]